MEYKFHQSQIDNAQSIVSYILARFYYILFHLRMQGGKTGSYLKAALDLLTDPDSKIDNVVIIAGFSDKALTSQLNTDVDEAIKYYCMSKYPNSKDSMNNYDLLTKKIKVYTGCNIKKMPLLKNNTLIIHDESHYAANKSNIPYNHFYKKNNIEKSLYGDFTQLIAKNIFIISVGATSFAEQISNKKVELGWTEDELSQFNKWVMEEKKIIYGKVGESYYGIKEYLDNNRIIFENVDPAEIIPTLENKQGYVIVRTHKLEKEMLNYQRIARENNMEYKCIRGNNGPDVLDFLEEKPRKMTLVHISGLARMGKVLCKKYINCVIETSKNPNSDTSLQALPGRMCGYDIPDNIKIYVSSKLKSNFEKFAKDELCLIDKATNVKKPKSGSKHTIGPYTKDKSGNWWLKTVPIEIKIKKIKFAPGETYKSIKTHHIENALDDNPGLISKNPNKDIILKMLQSGYRLPYRHSGEKSYHGFLEKFAQASKNNTRECCNFTNLITKRYTNEIIKEGSFGLFGNDKVMYFYGYIKTTKPTIPKLPNVNPKSIYFPTKQEDGEIINANGGQLILFPCETSNNIKLFESELEKNIERTISTHINYIMGALRKINSIYNCETKQYNGIFLNKTIFTQSKIKTVFSKLNKKYSIVISYNQFIKKDKKIDDINRLFPKEEFHRYTSISWVDAK